MQKQDRLPPRNFATSLRASLKATFSPATAQLLQEAVRPEPTSAVIASILKLDPALATAILSLVNSPYYGQSSKISDLQRAAIIGDNEILRIALSLQKNLNAILEKNGFDTYANWRIIIWAALGAQLVAERLAPKEAETAYICALVKDLSLLLYAATFPEHILPHLKQPDFVNTGPTFWNWNCRKAKLILQAAANKHWEGFILDENGVSGPSPGPTLKHFKAPAGIVFALEAEDAIVGELRLTGVPESSWTKAEVALYARLLARSIRHQASTVGQLEIKAELLDILPAGQSPGRKRHCAPANQY